MPNFIDLFAGCGGLSEGFYRQDGFFTALSHVEIDPHACRTLKRRMEFYGYNDAENSVLEMDITDENIIAAIEEQVGDEEVDVIIGGPPCQSFSSLGKAKCENGMQDDPRNFLFESYVEILNHFNPRFFVFENVSGLLSTRINGELIVERIFEELGENYNVNYDPDMIILNSADYGVPQIRKRVIIIGVRNDLDLTAEEIYRGIEKTHYDPQVFPNGVQGLQPYVTVRDAIRELPALRPGEGYNVPNFTSGRTNEFLERITSDGPYALTSHVARTHNAQDIERYTEMSRNSWTFRELLENRPDLNHQKQRVFGNSYVVQNWDGPSKTIIAHLYKDGNQFIHPDHNQGRTLTAREAARLQSFPDDFIFEGSRTQQYKQIGNAVPPLFAEAIANSIRQALENPDV